MIALRRIQQVIEMLDEKNCTESGFHSFLFFNLSVLSSLLAKIGFYDVGFHRRKDGGEYHEFANSNIQP